MGKYESFKKWMEEGFSGIDMERNHCEDCTELCVQCWCNFIDLEDCKDENNTVEEEFMGRVNDYVNHKAMHGTLDPANTLDGYMVVLFLTEMRGGR